MSHNRAAVRIVPTAAGYPSAMKLPVERSFWTQASEADTFAFLGDFRNAVEWDPGTQTCELTSGPVGPGATYRNVSTFLGRTVELTYTTLGYEPDHRLHFQGRNSSFVGDDLLTFASSGVGTNVHYRAEFDLGGLARIVAPLVALYLPRLADRTVAQMKRTLDAL